MNDQQKELSSTEIGTSIARTSDIAGQRLLPAMIKEVLGGTSAGAFHSFSGTRDEVFKLVSLARGPDAKSIDRLNPPTLLVKHYYCQPVEIVDDETGEIDSALRVVLIQPDMTAYCFSSGGIARDLASIIDIFGVGPYDPPLKLKIKPFTTKRGRVAFSLQPAD